VNKIFKPIEFVLLFFSNARNTSPP